MKNLIAILILLSLMGCATSQSIQPIQSQYVKGTYLLRADADLDQPTDIPPEELSGEAIESNEPYEAPSEAANIAAEVVWEALCYTGTALIENDWLWPLSQFPFD
jgi:hypothetical protein